MSPRSDFPASRASVAAARQFVLDAVADLSEDDRDVAALVVSELATNALVHAGSGFEVDVSRTATVLRIEVTDSGDGLPEVQSPPASEPHGRGLLVVRTLADVWGSDDEVGGPGRKSVWCELRLHREPAADRLPSAGAVPDRAP